jgi:hypothetical protein
MRAKHVAVLLLASLVFVVLPSAAGGSGETIKMSANDLNAACAAGGGHVAVTGSLQISGGTANLTGECDITPGPGAQVKISNAVIDATFGDFDVCFFPACGDGATVDIRGTTIRACAFCGLQIYAPGGSIKITDSTLSSNPAVCGGTVGGFPACGTNIISEGKVAVTQTTFLIDTNPFIHGGAACTAKDNTPSTATCS